jgi:hypothetical protein
MGNLNDGSTDAQFLYYRQSKKKKNSEAHTIGLFKARMNN